MALIKAEIIKIHGSFDHLDVVLKKDGVVVERRRVPNSEVPDVQLDDIKQEYLQLSLIILKMRRSNETSLEDLNALMPELVI